MRLEEEELRGDGEGAGGQVDPEAPAPRDPVGQGAADDGGQDDAQGKNAAAQTHEHGPLGGLADGDDDSQPAAPMLAAAPHRMLPTMKMANTHRRGEMVASFPAMEMRAQVVSE